MKYLYLALGIIFLILYLILYFQNISNNNIFLAFNKFIPTALMLIYIFVFSFFGGVFLVLGIKGILSNSKDMDDGFEL